MAEHPDHEKRDASWFLWGGVVVASVLAFSLAVGLVILPITQAPNAGIDAWTAICRAIGIAPGTPAQPQPPSEARAAPVSKVEWSPKTLKILASADQRPGEALAANVCSACHGEQGMATTAQFPRLAGQSPQAIYKQLSDYKTGARVHPQMTPVVQALTNDELAQVAAYFGGLQRGSALGTAQVLAEADIARLILRGDPARRLPPCESCHGRGVGGPPEAPIIAGQNATYMSTQLHAFKTGARRNDVYRRMRDISGRLSDDEIARLAAAYQGAY